MELLSLGTKLQYCETADGTFQTLYGLQKTPEMGGEPEKVQVTNLANKNHRYIRGVKDLGDLDFEFFYNDDKDNPDVTEDDVAASYSVLRALDKAGTLTHFKLIYPDGTGFAFSGTVTVKRSAAEVNQALQFTLRIMCQSELEDVAPAASAKDGI